MKRLICMLLAALLLTLAGCGGEPAETTEASTEPPPAAVRPTTAPTEESAPTDPPAQICPMAETVLADDENCTFAVLRASSNDYTGMELQVVCRNKTEKTLMFSWETVSVCGYMYDPVWSQKVEPGETVESTVGIDTFLLESYGILSVDEISFCLTVIDNENWMDAPLVSSRYEIFPTGKTAEAAVFPQRESVKGEKVFLNDDLTFIIEYAERTEQGDSLHCYVANATDKTVMFSWDSVEVDGCQLYPGWAVTVAPGKSAYSDIVFDRAALGENGIGEGSRIEFTMIVSDYDDWSAGYLVDEVYTYTIEYGEPVG